MSASFRPTGVCRPTQSLIPARFAQVGYKMSGLGSELGVRGLDAYTEWKTITVSLD